MSTENFYSTMGPAAVADTSPVQSGDNFSAAQKLFGDTTHREAILNDPRRDVTQNLPALNAYNENWRIALSSVEASAAQGRMLTDLVKQYGEAPPTAAERAGWLKETSENFTRQYGVEEGRARLALAAQLAQRDQVFRKTIDAAGITTHPKVAEALAELAWSARAGGRL